jgi:hypothetical protein
MHFVELLLIEKKWTKEELLDSIDEFKSYHLQEFITKFLTQGIFIESIFFGNITKEVCSKSNETWF